VLLCAEGEGADSFADSWRGKVQWVGKSPFHPHHKRKNWFVGVACFRAAEAPSWSEAELEVEVQISHAGRFSKR
jgi:peptide chain release factor